MQAKWLQVRMQWVSPSRLRALHAEVAVQCRLILARLADVVVSDADADELSHHRKPHLVRVRVGVGVGFGFGVTGL